MDTSLQIQGIKLLLDNMQMQIENIILQNNNQIMMVNPLGDQLLNLSMQMINTGLQAFNTGINLSMNHDKFYEQLSKISDQINNILNSHQIINLNMIYQQQMMQQQMMQQQMEEQQKILEQQNAIMQNQHKINVIFEDPNFGKTNIIVDQNITFKELFEKYKDKIGIEEYNQIKYFVTNAYKLLKDNNFGLKKYYPDISIKNNISISVVY